MKLKNVPALDGTDIKMLGTEVPLQWKIIDNCLEISIPDNLQVIENRPCKYSWVIKVNIN